MIGSIANFYGEAFGDTPAPVSTGGGTTAGCDAVHLDPEYQRHLAHQAYLRNGSHIDCHHMAWRVDRHGLDPPGNHDVVA